MLNQDCTKHKVILHKTEDNCFIHYRNSDGLAQIDLNKIGKIWYFSRLIVPEVMRNQGVGGMLVKTLVTWAQQNNCNILCEINPYGDLDYDALKAFYLRHGFKDEGDYLSIGDVSEYFEI